MKMHQNLLGAFVDSDLKQDKTFAADSARRSRRDRDDDIASGRGESQGEQQRPSKLTINGNHIDQR